MSKKELLSRKLIEIGAIKFGRFVLKSGRISNYYVDIKHASTVPDVLRIIAEELSERAKGYDIMAGMELGAVPLMAATSVISGVPYVIIRKKEKEHGIKDRIIGNVERGSKVVIVEDVTTTGGSALEVAEIVQSLGGLVDKIVCVVDREEGAEENLKKHGLKLDPILKISEIRELTSLHSHSETPSS